MAKTLLDESLTHSPFDAASFNSGEPYEIVTPPILSSLKRPLLGQMQKGVMPSSTHRSTVAPAPSVGVDPLAVLYQRMKGNPGLETLAFRQLEKGYSRKLLGRYVAQGMSPTDAEDLTLQVMLKCHLYLSRRKPQGGELLAEESRTVNVRGLVKRVARLTFIDYLRNKRRLIPTDSDVMTSLLDQSISQRHEQGPLMSAMPDAEARLEASELQGIIQLVKRQILASDDREAMEQRSEGRSYAEINGGHPEIPSRRAAKTFVSAAALRKRQQRARDAFRLAVCDALEAEGWQMRSIRQELKKGSKSTRKTR